MAAKTKPREERPGQPVRVEPDSNQARELCSDLDEYLTASLDSKREWEREALEAYQHYNSYLNPLKHQYPVPVYDPILFSSQQTRLAKFGDALFGQGPIAEFMPKSDTSRDQAKALNAVMAYHLKLDRPRRTFLNGILGCALAGNQVYHPFWDFQEREVWFWKRVPMHVTVLDPITQQPASFWIEDGKWKYVRTRKTVKDNCSIRTLHPTQIFPDTTAETIEGGEWFAFRDVISSREAMERVKTDKWDSRAVKRAKDAPLSKVAQGRLSDLFEWQREIGLEISDQERLTLAKDKRKSIEVIELYRRQKFGIERVVILNRMHVAWFGPSPFGHGLMPFVMAKNYTTDKSFWGISDYRVIKYLLRGIQAFANASAAEAVLGAMPPLLIPAEAEIIGKEYAPRAEWRLENCTAEQLKWLQPGTTSRQIAQAEKASFMERFDAALGSSDPGRGSVGSGDVKATTVSIATQMQGLRDKYMIDNLGDDVIVPWFEQAQDLICQNQSAEVQAALTGNPNDEPATIWPEDYRGGDYFVTPMVNTATLKELDKKRALELAQYLANNPFADGRHVAEYVVGRIAPDEVDRMLLPEQQQMQMGMQQQGMPGQVQQGPGPTPFSQGDTMHEAANDLAEAMAV